MEKYIYYTIIYFVEALILWQYCLPLFNFKYPSRIRAIVLTILYGILSVIFALNLVGINTLLFLVANFIYILFMHETSLLTAIFHAAITTTTMGLCELAFINLFPNMANNYYNSPDYLEKLTIIAIGSKLLYFLVLYLISHFISKSKEKKQPSKKETLLILAIPLISICITLTLLYICINAELPTLLTRMIIISALLLLIINVFTWMIYSHIQRKNIEFTEMQIQLQKEYDTSEYYRMLLQQDESQRILIHDIKKHLQSIALLNKKGQTDKVAAYINQLVNSSDLQTSARMCDNDIFNAILCRYNQQCIAQKIPFRTDIRSGVVDYIDDNDLTSLFCNLLENAMEAAANYSDGYIELSVNNRPNITLTVITLVNSCRLNPFNKHGELTSTKVKSSRHGFGMKSIQRIVNRYQGEMQNYYKEEDHTFHTIIILRNHNPSA